ncbi:glycoside hydrolase [Basidiobolus meristosporus CBS 931.73]|uniref:Glycoside hydrolase n=1 Tax=Basidiobolus meristosporus CBS 931.73 TaxID=1314790 RepID=A0A1Y1YSR1_9FUNG|nr:glycoside hydrolase [Basidiobolus meristosporus CBS 931.73]|eukprot:ORY00864.1 glycoside hydrolase [Basidiobolus meristosporus CBS 931.73]
MSPDSKSQVGQLLIAGFHGLTPDADITDLIQNHNLGSVILFSRNIGSAEQLRKLTYDLQLIAKNAGHARPLFICADQENGVVQRLGEAGTFMPGNMALGAVDSLELTQRVAVATAKELLALGVNWNLCPSLDVNNNPANPVIGVRSFGEDPEKVGRLGCAAIRGQQSVGIPTSIKHFPGHGDTATDSHLGLPVIAKSLEDLEKLELIPFQQAISSANPASVMIAHISLPAIIAKSKSGSDLPASIAREVSHDLLRVKMGYKGLIVPDCLEMDAVDKTFGAGVGALMSLKAGNDMAMVSHTYAKQKQAIQLIRGALESGDLDRVEFEASVKRVNELKDEYLSWDTALPQTCDYKIVGCKEHVQMRDDVYDLSTTVVRNDGGLLPLALQPTERILFLSPHIPFTKAIDVSSDPFLPFFNSLQKRHSNIKFISFDGTACDRTTPESKAIDEEVEKATVIIVSTANANLYDFQPTLVNRIIQTGKQVVCVAVINPYDIMTFPDVQSYIVTYEYSPPAYESATKVLFGEIEAKGKLPVTIPGITDVEYKSNKWTVEPYQSEHDFVQVVNLWDLTLGDKWPLSAGYIAHTLENGPNPGHFVVREDRTIVGFAATFQSQPDRSKTQTGHLALVLVSPTKQRQRVGSALHDHAMEHLRSNKAIKSIQLGSTYPRFFCGVPENLGGAIRFFQHRSWDLGNKSVFDLTQDLTNYETPGYVTSHMQKEGIWFGRIKPSELWELYAFEDKYFPYWLGTYQHHANLGDFQDLIVGRDGGPEGPIIAATILYTANASHELRSDVPWQHESLLNTDCGGMSCVGVAAEQRGRGIGVGMVAYANSVLKRRGVRISYVDWVDLVGFYRKTGYETWRGYKMSTHTIDA